jgi:menaquinone-specific isochorismate synthase
LRIEYSKIEKFTGNLPVKSGKKIISYAFQIEKEYFINASENLGSIEEKFFYTGRSSEKMSFAGIGSVMDVEHNGDERVTNSSNSIQNFQSSYFNNFDEFGLVSIPVFVGGMKFSPEENDTLWEMYSDSDWFIPKYLFIKLEDRYFLITNFCCENITPEKIQNAHDNALEQYCSNAADVYSEKAAIVELNADNFSEKLRWTQQVNNALEQIRAGAFQKIVLSRQVIFKLVGTPDLYKLLQQLETDYPRCYVFAFKKGDSVFFGASPEKLAKVSDGWVEADALAGSISRGSTPEEDLMLETELLNSKKNLIEQRAVVEFIKDSFASFSEEMIYNESPQIRKLANIQHLWTPIKARLKSDSSIFSILKDIHPTPAICGVPWTNALVSIKKMENHSRGLFAGMVGWFNFNNEGEFAVAIRSAILKNDHVYAFAGCGIVEGSDPESEYEEAELKLQPILSLFKNEEIYQS